MYATTSRLTAALALVWASTATAQPPDPTAPAVIPLYSGVAPGSERWDWEEKSAARPNGMPVVTDVVRPVLLHYPADRTKAVGAAMIVAPGGGFRALMMSYEGVDIARRLNAMGVDAFVLKYRLTHDAPGAPGRDEVVKLAGEDGRRAVRLVRERAGDFGYRPDRVGMIGFSAGGMVTSEALFGAKDTRPDFVALVYGIREIKEIPDAPPPLFLAVAADDAGFVGQTVDLFSAYRNAKGRAELHVFQVGAHGFVTKGGGADHFMDRLEEWLRANKLLTKPETTAKFDAHAREVTDYIQDQFFDPDTGVYFKSKSIRKPDYVWLQSVQFANLAAAARNDPESYGPRLKKYFTALDAFWDSKAKIPGYEPAPTRGDGDDKYYDDNAWLVITFLEAYETSRDPLLLSRADETLKFVLSGWDEEIGGGIWWHERHKDGTKNACSNGPSALGCLRLSRYKDKDALVGMARKIVEWTTGALQAPDALFDDRKVVASGEVKRGKLTYNSALMLRALLGLYRATGETACLDEARRIGKAADWFLDGESGVYRDAVKYSHFMIEADLELYRTTKEQYLLDRARRNVQGLYAKWKAKPPEDMISNAAIGRVLWLMAETESDAGRAFWRGMDDEAN